MSYRYSDSELTQRVIMYGEAEQRLMMQKLFPSMQQLPYHASLGLATFRRITGNG